MMKVFVTGGAGYIGAHVVRHLEASGYKAIIIDDFRTSSIDRVGDFAYENLPLENLDLLMKAFEKYKPGAVIHLAGFISVGESVKDPAKYWENNLGASSHLLTAVARFPIRKFIFSSTAATYGDVLESPITERSPNKPTCPYGESKLAFEKTLYATARALQFEATSFRYFNAAGCVPEWGVGEAHDPEEHLIPRIIEAIQKGKDMHVFGNDYPTPDGTCVRDYIHVLDLADIHVKALSHSNLESCQSYNVGTGKGTSVLEVIDAVSKELKVNCKILYGPRRAGDPASLIADSSKLREKMNWQPQHSTIEEIVKSAVKWKINR
jgi:UDP-glucose 4-epimerase